MLSTARIFRQTVLRSWWLTLAAVAAFAPACRAEHATINTNDGMRAGVAKVDITPELGMPYNLGLSQTARQIGHRLYARILFLEDKDDQTIIIATDWEGVMRTAHNQLRSAVSMATGVPEHHIVVNASHSHNSMWINLDVEELLAPHGISLVNRRYFDDAVTKIARAAAHAVQSAQYVSLAYGSDDLPGFASNRRARFVEPHDVAHFNERRRYPIGVTDPTLGVISLQTRRGKRLCVLHVFAAHPVTQAGNGVISGSYPGTAMAAVEDALGGDCIAMFLQGCGGNINPNPDLPTDSIEATEATGRIFAQGALAILANKMRPAASDQFTFMVERVALPLIPLDGHGTLTQLQEDFYAAIERYKAHARAGTERFSHRLPVIALGDRLTLARNLDEWRYCEVQVLRCGDLCLVMLPGETFVDYALEIRERASAGTVFVSAYNDCTPVYIPDPIAFEEGGYEVGPWCYSTPDTGRVMVDATLRLIEQTSIASAKDR
jgi:hypothetical protein